ncbi:ATP-binding cassette domain-containing protein [Streptomyces sp. NPDC053427]|uniref:ATP-binding cassette domain-containing protein n=1 Tax=Streptomyces sp. NPDC053427 TaxID=3365701 RepID=UPI0037D73DCF
MSYVKSSEFIDRAPDLVTLDNVTKIYDSAAGPVYGLRGVNLAVRAGVFLAVMGKEKSGKTTLLKCLSGETQPTSGSLSRRAGSEGDVVVSCPAPGDPSSLEAALARRPALLLADEASEECGAALRRAVADRGVAVVMATTAPAAAARADAVVFLNDGAVVDMVADAGPQKIRECLERAGGFGAAR